MAARPSRSTTVEEIVVSEPSPEPQERVSWYARVGTDWWATIVAGGIAVLAVTNLLPRIPW
ncbi:hypothetical protein CIW49_24145 [Mycolicibacterium sp. P1-18]|nr:hypothetical protein CIW49_24145 [Mycolicibacterium sp. P1-18]